MSEQSLRDALEQKLATTDGWAVSNEFLLGLLAAHPAEPAPVVTDEAVEAAYQAYSDDTSVSIHDGLRNALEAAAPLLGPRPLLDRETMLRAIVAASEPEGSDNIMGREYVENYADVFADAVLKLARPMPTREQIDPFLQEWRVRPPGQPTQQEAINYRRKMRNALLALLNGAES